MLANSTDNPIERFLALQPVMVLDGGLASTLETYGQDLDDDLWSARVLIDAPQAIRRVHRDFLMAGADCITTASYQASIEGFRRHGLSENRAEELLRLTVSLAVEARDEFWQDPANRVGRERPLVAASIGPYGAFLADGSEYTGAYEIDEGDLYAFHRDRWRILARSDTDLLACETVPSRVEAEVLCRLLRETPGRWAWLSFSCRDGEHLNDGSTMFEVAGACGAEARVAAVGINCTAPQHIASLVGEVRRATSKPVIVYPNSGEHWDAKHKVWGAAPATFDWEDGAAEWARRGARCVGGCCRIGPAMIATLRRRLVG